MKHCPCCGRTRRLDSFYQEPGRPGGYSSECMDCKRARARDNALRRYDRMRAEQGKPVRIPRKRGVIMPERRDGE